ncbi:MAG: alpha/beta hydrolase [Anaerolineae bacterium]|nr:alpha/beta hydrolase [Anaerolineae bacterium]
MITEKIYLYEGRQDVTLTTYVLDDSPEMLNGKKRPGVLICPGGAFVFCSDREAEPVALRFAAMGYHAFVLRYSTFGKGVRGYFPVGEEVEVDPESMHPAPMRDVGRAFLELHKHADDWLLDMGKIAICGFSAGGHTCAMYSVYWNDPLITDYFGEPAEKFKPAASILAYPVTDYHVMVAGALTPEEQAVSDLATFALLGTKTPSEAQLNEVSPALHVTEHTPPTFLWSTSEDTLVPVENTTHMATALAKAGVPFEVHIFERGVHGLSLANQATATNTLQMVNADAAKWMDLAEVWLEKRFGFDLPPTLG